MCVEESRVQLMVERAIEEEDVMKEVLKDVVRKREV